MPASRPDWSNGQLAFGEEGEHLVAGLLMDRGVSVMPVYQYEQHDRAPVLLYKADGAQLNHVLPDLTCWGQRGVFFAEVKRKRGWVRWDGRLETGFNQRHFDEYVAVEGRTSTPIWVFFVHEEQAPTGIYMQRLSVLRGSVRRWDGRHCKTGARIESPLALFPRDVLKRWCDLPAESA